MREVVLQFFAILILLSRLLSQPLKIGVSEIDEVNRSKELASILKRAAGVYQDPLHNPNLNKTVIITGSNYGYLNFLHNFKCFTDRLKMKVLVFSMDSKIHVHIENRMNSTFSSFYWHGNQTITEDVATFRSTQFNLITHRKTEAIIAVMTLGYDVIFIDSDIALVRDPIPYLIWRNVDYAFSHNKICPQ
jgi:hypothetical protein